MNLKTARRSRSCRSSTLRYLKPRIDDLEPRALLSIALPSAHTTFQVRSFAGGGPPSGAYTPAQLQEAYGFNSITFNGVAGTGSGETIAIVDAYNDPNIQADLNTFDTQFGLPATTVTRVNETGGTSYPASDPTGGWELEESLDVEWAHAMAPGAKILLVEASSTSFSDLFAAVNYGASHANVVSMSWGGSEFSGETADDTQYFDHAGVAFVASSGDSGAPASYPAASPNVLGVGGTALTLGPGNLWSSEVGWSGSTGGPSAYESQPSYQNGVVTQTSTARATPDVAYDASPSTGVAVYDSVPYEGTTYGWIQVGGTSAGAPQWSALLAIADQGLALSGQSALNSRSPQQVMSILYANPTDFHDITSGTSTGTPNYSAGPGYDFVTGLGSPVAKLIAGSLDGASPSSHDSLVLSAPTAETAGTPFRLTVTAENSSGKTDIAYTGTIHFTSSDAQASLPANFSFTAGDDGTYSFTVTLKTAGSQSITATDTVSTQITGTQSGITVAPAAPTNLAASAVSSTQINLTWTGSSGATGYLIQQSLSGSNGWTQVGSTTTSTSFQQTGLTARTTYYFRVLATLGTIDSGYSNVASATTTGTTNTENSIWGSSFVPSENTYSYGSYEVGVKFTATEAGDVTGDRFYKQTWMGGYAHVGNLWSSTGTLLATANYTNESASGWQQVNFASPVAITANTVYIISFSTGGGYFGITTGFFTSGGVTNGPLEALPNSVSGGDGVYNRAGRFPNVDSNGMNFWADVAFTPSSSGGVAATASARGSRSIPLSWYGSSYATSGQSNLFFTSAQATTPAGPARYVGGWRGTIPTVQGSFLSRQRIVQVATLAPSPKKSSFALGSG